jgi:hypothetical protein
VTTIARVLSGSSTMIPWLIACRNAPRNITAPHWLSTLRHASWLMTEGIPQHDSLHSRVSMELDVLTTG